MAPLDMVLQLLDTFFAGERKIPRGCENFANHSVMDRIKGLYTAVLLLLEPPSPWTRYTSRAAARGRSTLNSARRKIYGRIVSCCVCCGRPTVEAFTIKVAFELGLRTSMSEIVACV